MHPMLLIMAATLLVPACTAPLGTYQTARALQKGENQVQVGAGIPLATQIAESLWDNAQNTEKRIKERDDGTVTNKELADLAGGSAIAALMSPVPILEFSYHRGLFDGFDAGFRLSSNTTEAEVKWAFIQREKFASAIAARFAHINFKPPSAVDFLKYADFSRNDLEGAWLVSYDASRYFSFYGGAKYRRIFVSARQEVVDAAAEVSQTKIKDTSTLAGGLAGLKLQWSGVSLLLELNVLKQNYEPKLFGKNTELNGLVFYPGAALGFQFM